jgi:hypothetical protein
MLGTTLVQECMQNASFFCVFSDKILFGNCQTIKGDNNSSSGLFLSNMLKKSLVLTCDANRHSNIDFCIEAFVPL